MVQVTFAAFSVALLAAVSSVQAHPYLTERSDIADCVTAITGTFGFGSISSKGVARLARTNAALSSARTQTSAVTGSLGRYVLTLDSTGAEVAASSFEWANCTAALKDAGWELKMPSNYKSIFGSTGKTFEYGWGIVRPEGASTYCLSLQSAPVSSAFTNERLLSVPCASTTHATRIFFAAREADSDTATTFMTPVPLIKSGTTVSGSAVVGTDSLGTIRVSSASVTSPRYLTLTPEDEGC